MPQPDGGIVGDVFITLRDTRTGHQVTIREPVYDWDGVVHHWTTGNFGCDCNRTPYFDQPPFNQPEVDCNHDGAANVIELVRIIRTTDGGQLYPYPPFGDPAWVSP